MPQAGLMERICVAASHVLRKIRLNIVLAEGLLLVVTFLSSRIKLSNGR